MTTEKQEEANIPPVFIFELDSQPGWIVGEIIAENEMLFTVKYPMKIFPIPNDDKDSPQPYDFTSLPLCPLTQKFEFTFQKRKLSWIQKLHVDYIEDYYNSLVLLMDYPGWDGELPDDDLEDELPPESEKKETSTEPTIPTVNMNQSGAIEEVKKLDSTVDYDELMSKLIPGNTTLN